MGEAGVMFVGTKVQASYCGRKEGGQLEYLGVNGRIILKLVFKKEHGRVCTAFMWHRIRAIEDWRVL